MTLTEQRDRLLKNIENFKKMLEEMPEDTVLGRLCIEGYIRRDQKRLKKVLAEIEKAEQANQSC